MNEKFNKNAKVEKLTKKVGRGVRLIVIGPLIYPGGRIREGWERLYEVLMYEL